jgi:tight adherence protein C
MPEALGTVLQPAQAGFLGTVLRPGDGPDQLIILALVFAAVVLGVIGLAAAFRAKDAGRRLNASSSPAQAPLTIRYGQDASLHRRLLRRFEGRLGHLDGDKYSRIRIKLVRAGYNDPSAPRTYYTMRLVLALGFPIVVASLSPFLLPTSTVASIMAFTLAAAAAGYLGPLLWVERRERLRAEAVRLAFPDALDLLLVCVESGLGIDEAIARVGQEIRSTSPILAEQFQTMSLEIRNGRGRDEVLSRFAQRVAVDEVTSFASLINQSSRLGASIGDALRVAADDMRRTRLMRGEEAATKVPIKMAFPLGLFLIPALLIVVVSPAVLTMIRVVLPALSGN